MEDFIKEGIAQLNEKLTPDYGTIFWYLDTDYQEGDPAYLMGYAQRDNKFIDIGIHKQDDEDSTINIRIFDGEDWNLI
jgi:hypothetical protein